MQALPRQLDRLLAVTMTISRFAISLGGGAVLISAFLIAGDVVMRRFFGVSTWGADELSYYALAISTSWALAYTMLVKAHIRIDLLSARFQPPLRAIFDIVALVGMGFLAIVACQAIFHVLQRSFTRGATSITTLQTPLWIPQGLFFAGLVFFTLVTALILLRVIVAITVERSYESAERVAGTSTIEEETNQAIAEAEAAEGGKR